MLSAAERGKDRSQLDDFLAAAEGTPQGASRVVVTALDERTPGQRHQQIAPIAGGLSASNVGLQTVYRMSFRADGGAPIPRCRMRWSRH